MKSVSVKQLQNDLNHYLDEARSGEEVLVKERNKPIVKLVLLNGNGHSKTSSPKAKPLAKKKSPKALPPLKDDPLYISDKELAQYHAQLVAEGKMTLPKVEPTAEFWEEFFNEPRPKASSTIPLKELQSWINEDRDED